MKPAIEQLKRLIIPAKEHEAEAIAIMEDIQRDAFDSGEVAGLKQSLEIIKRTVTNTISEIKK